MWLISVHLWLLNDACEQTEDTCELWLEIGDEEHLLMVWNTGTAEENTNKLGNTANFVLPPADTDRFTLRLKSAHGYDNAYTMLYRRRTISAPTGQMNV